MKRSAQLLFLTLAALATAACTHSKAPQDAPAATAEQAATVPSTAAAPKTAEQAESETAEKPGFFARLFGLGKKQEAEAPAEPARTTKKVEPTPAQQEAAYKLLEGADAPIPSPEVLTPGGDNADFAPAAPRRGLRLGHFAPPEEAASSAENTAPRPNAVDLHGLRSPSLPGGQLPMDINGKLTTESHD